MSLPHSGPHYRELAGPDLSRPDARLLHHLRADYDADVPVPFNDLLEQLEGTLQRMREQTLAMETIIAAARRSLAQ